MKKIYYILSLFLLLSVVSLSAFDKEGVLSAGEGSSFTPVHGAAFSIVLDIKSGFYSGEYKVLVRSNGKVIYNEYDQIDDIYLVFNEATNSNDIIKIDVKRGQFKFKLSKIDDLPEPIVKALKRNLQTIKRTTPSYIPQIQPRQQIIQQDPVPEEVGFFDTLRENINTVFKSEKKEKKIIKKIDKVSEPIKKIEKKILQKPVNTIKPPKSIAHTNTIEKPSIKKRSTINIDEKKIDFYDKSIPQIFNAKGVQIGGISPTFKSEKAPYISNTRVKAPSSDIAHQRVQKPSFEKIIPTIKTQKISEVSQVPKFNQSMEALPDAKLFDMDEVPSFRQKRVPVPVPSQIETIKEVKTKFDNRVVQKANEIKNIAPISKPVFEEPIREPISKPVFKEPVIQYTPEPVFEEPVIAQPIIEKPKLQPVQPIQNDRQRIVITKTLTPKQKKDKDAKDSSSRVIKRHIEPAEYKDSAVPIPDRMDDRVQGGGYGVGGRGNIQVKATINNKPVSAWIEVFKAGTTNRVKTFYTGKGSSLKDIKLPAGVYVIKATYRSKTHKKRRNLGKIVLGEGESINKNISFDDGKVKIVATKSGNPLYVKVEVFKKGSSRRLLYEFTSRRNGIAILNLGSGRYDIVVNDHKNILNFDNIKVKANKTRVINADF